MDKNDEDFDIMLRHALSPEKMPDKRINKVIISKVRERKYMKNSKRTAIIAVAAVVVFSATAFAAWKYLKPENIASEVEDSRLAEAFKSDGAVEVNETQVFDDYKVTFLGTVSGEELTDFISESDGVELTDRTYAVTAIEKADGTPMPDTSSDNYNEVPFLVTPLIKGTDPKIFNAVTMNGGYSEIVQNGIMYRIAECDNIEMFAYKGVYLAVMTSTFYDNNAYIYNEETGEITRNTHYSGVNALFDLPLDMTKGDETKGEEYIKAMQG